jgi:hypothetical protein
MSTSPLLPRAQAAIVGAQGIPTREFYNFLLSLAASTTDDTLQAQITALAARVAVLENEDPTDATIQGLNSVRVDGTLAGGAVVITLQGDVEDPGLTFYYGTNAAGEKGWYAVADTITATQDGIELLVGADGVTDIRPDDDLEAVESLTTTGLAVRTGDNTWTTRGILPGPGIDVTFSNGVAGDPTIAHANTSSVTDITATFTGGTVPDQISLTFDTFGHVLTRNITGRTLDHNDTGALQGGNATERYHFTAAEHAGLLPWASEAPGDYALITQTITDGDTTHAPSGDAVFDALEALDYVFPFILQTGSSPISLTTDRKLPFFLGDGSASNIAVIP